MLLYLGAVAVMFSMSDFSRNVKRNVFLASGGIGAVLLTFAVYAYHNLLESYQTERISAFIHPDLYSDSAGYMMLQLSNALSAPGWFGSKTSNYIPEAHTDYALVQFIQSYGYAAGIAVILVIFAITLRILWIAKTMQYSFGKLLILAAAALYSCQSLYSILMVFGFLPLTSVPLPFMSYGLMPMLLNALLIGLVLSVYRRKTYSGKSALSVAHKAS